VENLREEMAVDYDLVVRGGLIVDGSGEPAIRATSRLPGTHRESAR